MTSVQRFRALLAIAAQLAIATTSSAQARQTLSGRVLGDSSRPIAGAVVSVTMAPNRVLRQDTTRADGRWSVRFDSASGDYLVHIAALGHQAFRQRVTTMSSDTVVTVNAALSPNVQQLAAVTVKASRPKVARELDPFPLPDGISAEYITAGVTGAVSPELQGDLAAIAAAIPGLALTAGGVSAFGLDALQNGATLNGMSFAGASLPRNAGTVTRFTTSTYDPSRGGFSGVETAVSLSPGNIYSRRRANVTIDAPPLQVTDRVSARLGQRVTGGLGSIGSSGSWVEDSWYYSASADVARRVSAAPSLLNADASLFPLAGVAADSVTQLLRTLSTLGIPATASGAGTQRLGLTLVRNFNSPYQSATISEFWKRWHISLSEFITTYLYTPILRSMGRPTLHKSALATLVAMLIAGIWHGASWNFVLFGVMHGTALAGFQYWKRRKRPLPRAVAVVLTFAFVNLAFITVRAPSVKTALRMAWNLLPHGNHIGMETLHGAIATSDLRMMAIPLVVGCIAAFGGPNAEQLATRRRPSILSDTMIITMLLVAYVFMDSRTVTEFRYRQF